MQNEITAVSLFSGAGGMDVGFESAGVKIVFANEIIKDAADIYNANHPSGRMVNADIYNIIETMNQYNSVCISMDKGDRLM